MDIGTTDGTSSESWDWHLDDLDTLLVRGTVSMLQPWEGKISADSLLFQTEDDMMIDETATIHARLPIPAISQLPVEILTEIFFCYLVGGGEVNMLPNAPSCLSVSSKSRFNPMALESVCEHWRDILNSTPLLWSSICIFRPSYALLRQIPHWLQYASECPLTLELRQSDNPSYSEQLATDRIMELVFGRFSQWKSIEFHIDKFAVVSALSHLPSSPPVWLEHALLNISPRSYSNLLESLWNIVHASPALRSVHWQRFQDPASSIFAVDHPSFLGNVQVRCQINSRIPLSQLIDLQVSSEVTCMGALEVLRSCHNLEILNMAVDMSQSLPALDTLVVSNLRDLHVMVAGNIAPLLDHISLPALEKLLISKRFAVPIAIGYSFRRFIVRSNCPLRTFKFSDDYGCSEDDVLELLNSPLPSLVDLDLDCRSREATISALTCTVINGNMRCLMPRLENLNIRVWEIQDEIIARMVLSRIYYHNNEASPLQISFLKSVKISGFLYPLLDSSFFQMAKYTALRLGKDMDKQIQMVANLYRKTRKLNYIMELLKEYCMYSI